MAHRPKQTIWKRRILYPFWIVRIVLMLLIIPLYIVAFVSLRNNKNVTDHMDWEGAKNTAVDFDWEKNKGQAIAVIIVFLLLCAIVLLLDIVAILMFARHNLKPFVFLSMNFFQTSFWCGILIVDIIAITKADKNVRYGIGFTVFVFVVFLLLFIYSIVVFVKDRKMRKRGHHQMIPTYDVRHSYDAGTGHGHSAPVLPNIPHADHHDDHGVHARDDTPLVVNPHKEDHTQAQNPVMKLMGGMKVAHVH